MSIFKKKINEFPAPYTCKNAVKKGGLETKLSMALMGFGNIVHGQIIKGLLYLAIEIAYIVFMAVNGIGFIGGLRTLGTVKQQEVWDEAKQIYLYTKGDQSVLILLYGVTTILLTILMILVWRGALKSAYKAECLQKKGMHVNTFAEDLKSLLHENLYRLFMTPPTAFIFVFTVLPLVFMICMAFTNYSRIGNHLMLFDWVGLDNFKTLFDSGSILGSTFWSVLGWTIIWAFFATFSNYIFGMILSLLINRKGTRAKGFWRFCFVLSCAVPMFVSLAIDEAALLDGCTRWQIFSRITLPLSKPIIVYTVLTSFMAPWLDFIFAKVICRANSDQYTIAIGLWKMLEKEYIDSWYTSFAAGAVLISIPIAILFLFMQRYYVDGVSGAVKG